MPPGGDWGLSGCPGRGTGLTPLCQQCPRADTHRPAERHLFCMCTSGELRGGACYWPSSSARADESFQCCSCRHAGTRGLRNVNLACRYSLPTLHLPHNSLWSTTRLSLCLERRSCAITFYAFSAAVIKPECSPLSRGHRSARQESPRLCCPARARLLPSWQLLPNFWAES